MQLTLMTRVLSIEGVLDAVDPHDTCTLYRRVLPAVDPASIPHGTCPYPSIHLFSHLSLEYIYGYIDA